MSNKYEPNLVTLVDEDGNSHVFEEIDQYTDLVTQCRYIALSPVPNKDGEDSDELIILTMHEEDGETILEPIENDTEFDVVSQAFQKQLADRFDFE